MRQRPDGTYDCGLEWHYHVTEEGAETCMTAQDENAICCDIHDVPVPCEAGKLRCCDRCPAWSRDTHDGDAIERRYKRNYACGVRTTAQDVEQFRAAAMKAIESGVEFAKAGDLLGFDFRVRVRCPDLTHNHEVSNAIA